MKKLTKLTTYFSIYFFDHDSQAPQSIKINDFNAAKSFYNDIHTKLVREAKTFNMHMTLWQIQHYVDGMGAEKSYYMFGHTHEGPESSKEQTQQAVQVILNDIRAGKLFMDQRDVLESVPQGMPLYSDAKYCPWAKPKWMDLPTLEEHLKRKREQV